MTLADALAMEPQLLLLDEPAASLDPVHAGLLEENLAMLSQRGLALVVATHDVDFAWRWADRVLVFHNGTLAADGGPAQIFEQEELLRRCGLEPVSYTHLDVYKRQCKENTLLLPTGQFPIAAPGQRKNIGFCHGIVSKRLFCLAVKRVQSTAVLTTGEDNF